MRRLYYCDNNCQIINYESFADDYLVETNIVPTRADDLVGSTKAFVSLPGDSADPDGVVIWAARHGGLHGNNIRVRQLAGPSETGNESLPLSIVRDNVEFTVLFGTDVTGTTVVPTAQAVAAAVLAETDVADYVTALAGGTGLGLVGVATYTNLSSGADNGNWRKFNDRVRTCRQINSVEIV